MVALPKSHSLILPSVFRRRFSTCECVCACVCACVYVQCVCVQVYLCVCVCAGECVYMYV